MSSIGDIFGGVGAATDLFGKSIGSLSSANAYSKEAQIASSNADITARSTAIQEQQQNIKVIQSLGAEQADTASAGFTMGGSAGDLLRASAQQGALSKQLIANQGEITQQGYEQQAAAARGQAAAAKTSAGGGILGGLLDVAKIAIPFL